jgi:hypothetical protein
LDPGVMIEVLNAGSGATSASRDKFPRAILPRTFDYGFATALMVKECGQSRRSRSAGRAGRGRRDRSDGSGRRPRAIKARIPISRPS